MSIHKSKGLEFPVVFLCNLSRKFNTDSLTGQILCDRDLGIGLSVADPIHRLRYPSVSKRAIAVKMETESVSEEMRVLYVAMTRARDRLIMTYASKSVVSDLQDTALRMDFDGGELLCRDASCPGDWVLLTAMGRTEAGDLQAVGGKPVETTVSAYPWKICFPELDSELTDGLNTVSPVEAIPEGAEAYLRRALTFRYAHDAATLTPSKQTATDRKGREKDEESTQDTQVPQNMRRVWRRPSFRNGRKDAAAYGNAVHLALQYIHFENCGSLRSVEQEMERLCREGFLTQEQTAMVSCKMISEFFETQIGKKLLSGTPCLREFKFSILEEGNRYGTELEGEQVLLQGVVDCALLEEDGITVIDFKTDHVTEKTLESVICRYRLQVETYADALSRIYEKPVKEKLLYFFHLGRFAQV